MSSVLRLCRKCGAKIFADAPEGLCTACLFETGLDLFALGSIDAADPSAVASAKADDRALPENVEQSNTNAVPNVKKAPRLTKTLANFGDYELLDEIGRGGQGVVYRARQKSLNRTVALKVIGLGHWATEAHLKRFRREAEAAASLDHSGIVPIYEVGERDGSCYFSMKLVEGGQLDQVAKREPMPIRKAVELIAKVARTVHYAHEHSILHRDIKPGNVLLDQKGEPHLTDFGLARLVETESTVTRTMEVLGTPSYMAPEQAVGNNATVSSMTDVYGLGAVLYQLLTGQPPFAGGTTYETIKLLLDTEPRRPRLLNPKIDHDLSTICLKCLEKDPKRRYSSALALAEDLERWLKHEPIQARRTGVFARGRKWLRRNPTTAFLAASLVALAAAAGWIVWKSEFVRHPVTTGIAVLPFDNLDGNEGDAVLADSLQDDILTRLAKVAGLKVISRTSVMRYRGARNMQQIKEGLHVSHVLEGSVRREGDAIHLNAQLIDTQTDEHVWAEHYDRPVRDLFAIQTDLAQKVTDQLHTKLSPNEKAALEERPTKDIKAYSLYYEAASVIDQIGSAEEGKDQEKAYLHAMALLTQAITRDPNFVLAYCRLAEANIEFYFHGFDRSSRRLELAKSAIDSAFRLQPDSGEAHLALATYFYHCYFDYDRARDELDIARRSLPNNARIFQWSGLIDRRQNRWHDAVRDFNNALALDPQNRELLAGNTQIYFFLRDYKKAMEMRQRMVALHPTEDHRWFTADFDLILRADTRALHALLQQETADDYETSVDRLRLALRERDTAAAERALERLRTLGEDAINVRGVGDAKFNRAYLEGLIDRLKGDAVSAKSAFTKARMEQEKAVSLQPQKGPALSVLGLIDAALGRKEDALREGKRALELSPPEKDSLDASDVLYYFVVICAWVGERDLAIEQLQASAKLPAGVSYAEISLDPHWDPLRGDPRFEKIVASLAPKDLSKEIVSK
jgi:TolB-like protein/Tfp pilus assembly protein PilF/predicted Ser/Thr protein kinase